MDSDSMLKYEGKLARWENGWMYTKEALKNNAAWKKTRKIMPGDFLVRVYNGVSAALHKIYAVKNIFINKDGTLAAFTVSFGASPVTSAGLIDLKKNSLLFAADLKIKPKGSGGPPQLAMEHTWFAPCITEDGKYLACDGFRGTGEREAAIISMTDKNIEELPGSAMPVINGDKVFFLEQDAGKKNNHLRMRPLAGGKNETAGSFKGRPIGMEALGRNIYVITETKIFSCDAAAGGNFQEIHDYKYLNKGYDYMAAEKTFSGMINNRGYVFLAVKSMKNGKYEWMLFGLEVE
jgi:hypothetical protein